MASFTIGDYRFDVLSHERIIKDGRVKEHFVVDAFYQNQPLNWHPNQPGHDDYPGIPNRTNYDFVGQEVINVTGGGTKRGADFRTRFWPNLMHVARKARAASANNKTVSETVDAEMDDRPFQNPTNLRGNTLDSAVERLVRG